MAFEGLQVIRRRALWEQAQLIGVALFGGMTADALNSYLAHGGLEIDRVDGEDDGEYHPYDADAMKQVVQHFNLGTVRDLGKSDGKAGR